MRWIVMAVVMVACAPPDEGDFPEVWARVNCNRQHECDKGQFESSWENMDDCRAQMTNNADAFMDAWDFFGGEYDRDHAGECLSAMRSASCEEVSNNDFGGNCDNVYD